MSFWQTKVYYLKNEGLFFDINLVNQFHGSGQTQEFISCDIASSDVAPSRVFGASVQQSPIIEDANSARIKFEMPFVVRRKSFASKCLVRLIEALHFALFDVVQYRTIVHVETAQENWNVFVSKRWCDLISREFIYRICSGRPVNGFNLMTGATYLWCRPSSMYSAGIFVLHKYA